MKVKNNAIETLALQVYLLAINLHFVDLKFQRPTSHETFFSSHFFQKIMTTKQRIEVIFTLIIILTGKNSVFC